MLCILLFIIAGVLAATKEEGSPVMKPTNEITQATIVKSTPKLVKNKKEHDPHNNTEVIAQLGGTAALRCHTQKMPDQLVTWMKRGDEQLLTAGLQVYSSEKRYSAAHLRHQKVWELRIRDVKLTDSGSYECQITTHPPVSILFTLRVVEARAVIGGPSELHVHEGSRLKLHCHVDLATEPPLYVFWFHNETMINFEAKRPLRVTKQQYTSSLTITNVSRADAGTYRCEPHLAMADNVTLHVVAGENSAAMQKGNNNEDGTHFAQTSSGTQMSLEIHFLVFLTIASMLIMFTYEYNEEEALISFKEYDLDTKDYQIVHLAEKSGKELAKEVSSGFTGSTDSNSHFIYGIKLINAGLLNSTIDQKIKSVIVDEIITSSSNFRNLCHYKEFESSLQEEEEESCYTFQEEEDESYYNSKKTNKNLSSSNYALSGR